MTAVEPPATGANPAQPRASVGGLRKALSFGAGLGISVGSRDMEVMLVVVRPSGIRIVAHETIERYAETPANEWGGRIRRVLQQHDQRHLGATVLLPRGDVSVRQIALPGVSGKDMAPAIALQIDTLHPYGDEEAVSAWRALPGRNGAVLVGVARQETIERFSTLFAEAGVPVAAFTFPAAAIYAALRLTGPPPSHLLTYTQNEFGNELYGESPARPVFSAEMEVALPRALGLAASELRLTDEAPAPLEDLLPPPVQGSITRPLLYATALAGACPWLSAAVNLLPPEKRTVKSRSWLIPTVALTILLICAAAALLIFHTIDDRRYLDSLHAEMARLEPVALQAAAIDRRTADAGARAQALDAFRRQTQADLGVLNELTRLLAPPVWTNSTEIYPDSVTITGEAPQAEPLLKLLNSSPLFQGAEFITSVTKLSGGAEQFRIKAMRRPRP